MGRTSRVETELPEPPAAKLIEELLTYEVAWLSDATGANLLDPGIRALYPGIPRIAGRAITVKTTPGDFLMIPAAMKHSRPGDVLIIDGRGDATRAIWGEYFSEWARGLGIRGVLIDGAVRDVGAIEALDYPVFARSSIARGPTMTGPGEVNVPVSCGGITVVPGDIVVADREGAIILPLAELPDLLEPIRKKAKGEQTHHGFPAGDRQAFDRYYERAFSPRIAAATGKDPGDVIPNSNH